MARSLKKGPYVDKKLLRRVEDMVTKSVRPTQKDPQGGLVKKEAAMSASKAMLVCPSCGKATRVGRSFLDNGKKVRVCKKCGEIIDKI